MSPNRDGKMEDLNNLKGVILAALSSVVGSGFFLRYLMFKVGMALIPWRLIKTVMWLAVITIIIVVFVY